MEVIEGTAVEVPAHHGWGGDAPFYLVFEPDDGSGNVGIDLDVSGWIEANREIMRAPGTWLLLHKATGRPMLALIVERGEQFYFTIKHVGNLMVGSEISSYGIGKRVPPVYREGERTYRGKVRKFRELVEPERMVRLWLLPNGIVCGGDDVEIIAARMLGG